MFPLEARAYIPRERRMATIAQDERKPHTDPMIVSNRFGYV